MSSERQSENHRRGPGSPEDIEGDRPALGRADVANAAGVSLVAFAVYLFTLAPGLLRADSGELQTLAVTLGYAHPTGYPVYMLLAKVFTWLPVGEVAYRVNLMSAVMGALAAALTCLLGRVLTGRRWAPVVGAAALAFSPTFWSQAIIAEVYTTGAVCTLAVMLALALWLRGGSARWVFVAGCMGGVSLGVHATVALMAPAAVIVVAITRQRRLANLAAATAGALLGVAVTLAAFWVIDRQDSPASYFRTVIEPSRTLWDVEPADMDGFLDRVRLSMSHPQFRGLLTSQAPRTTLHKAGDYAANLAREFPWPWLLSAVAGLIWLAKRNGRMALLLGLTYLGHLAYDLQFDGVVHVMYIATYVPIAVLGIAGLALVDEVYQAWSRRRGRTEPSATGCDRVLAIFGLAVVLWPMFLPGAWNVEGRRTCWVPPGEDPPRVEYSAEFHQDVRELIDDLEPDAVVFTGWCLLYPYYYVAHIEQDRTDLAFLQDYHSGDQPELADSALEYIRETAPRRPVYLTSAKETIRELYNVEPVRKGNATLYRIGPPRQQEGGP